MPFFLGGAPGGGGGEMSYTRDWGSLLHFSESGRGRLAQSYYLLLALRLDYMEFAMEATTELKMGGGGSTHATGLGLGISAPTPNFRVLFGTGRGHSSIFSSLTRLQEILKSHHLQARVTLAALCVPPQPQRSHFFQQ